MSVLFTSDVQLSFALAVGILTLTWIFFRNTRR